MVFHELRFLVLNELLKDWDLFWVFCQSEISDKLRKCEELDFVRVEFHKKPFDFWILVSFKDFHFVNEFFELFLIDNSCTQFIDWSENSYEFIKILLMFGHLKFKNCIEKINKVNFVEMILVDFLLLLLFLSNWSSRNRRFWVITSWRFWRGCRSMSLYLLLSCLMLLIQNLFDLDYILRVVHLANDLSPHLLINEL